MTSIGSLVGSNFLACVEDRRDQVRVIGTNSVADAPNNFACDTVYLSSETAETDKFLALVDRIIRTEKPDLILPGRDEDVYALALLREREVSFRDRIAVGSSRIASMMLDKYATFEFTQQNDLPFARTISTDNSLKNDDAERLLQQTGFPLIAKPRQGYASLGVFFIINETQLANTLDKSNYVIQEYIGNRADVYDHADELEAGIPLFFEIPDNRSFGGQVQISLSGDVSAIFPHRVTNRMGIAVEVGPVINSLLSSVIERYAACFADVGWRGSLNVQCRPRNGVSEFVAIELNGRMSGGSSARLVLGFDEVGMLVEGFGRSKTLSSLNAQKTPDVVVRALSDYPIFEQDVRSLEQEGMWQRSPPVEPS